jgi:hypothetical protein
MRECLIYLTHLDPGDTQETMLAKLGRQVCVVCVCACVCVCVCVCVCAQLMKALRILESLCSPNQHYHPCNKSLHPAPPHPFSLSKVDGSEWSWHNLNTLCWAIGSISGALSEMQEKVRDAVVILL